MEIEEFEHLSMIASIIENTEEAIIGKAKSYEETCSLFWQCTEKIKGYILGAVVEDQQNNSKKSHAEKKINMESFEVMVVRLILKDFTDRRGLRQAWEEIDEEIQKEIVEKWEEIVKKAHADR